MIYAPAFSADGQWLASGSGDYTARIWDVSKTGTSREKSAAVLEGHTHFVYGVAFSPDGSNLIATAGGEDNDIYLWDAKTAKVKTRLAGQGKSFRAAASGGQNPFYKKGSGLPKIFHWEGLDTAFFFESLRG